MTPNGVPVRVDPKDYPDSKQFLHAYHHPEHVRPDHHWVDWFVAFDEGDQRTNGLEFVEGIWAEKLAFIAILATVAIIVTSIVWCVLGGSLQTVFTVMSFVLGLVTGEPTSTEASKQVFALISISSGNRVGGLVLSTYLARMKDSRRHGSEPRAISQFEQDLRLKCSIPTDPDSIGFESDLSSSLPFEDKWMKQPFYRYFGHTLQYKARNGKIIRSKMRNAMWH